MAHTRSAIANFSACIPAEMKCSICFENVVDENHKGISMLQCGHFFHLACIGPEFNIKGAMVCPNCRKVEDSEWKYSLGGSTQNHLIDNDESSDEDDGNAYNEYIEHHSSALGTLMHAHRMLGSFPLDSAPEMPFSAIYGGNSNNNSSRPYVHFQQHTYVGPTQSSQPIISSSPNSHAVNIVNYTMDYCRDFLNGSNFTLGGSSIAGTSTDGRSSLPRPVRLSDLQTSLGGPLSSTPSTMALALNLSREVASVDPPELALNLGIGGGSLSTHAHGYQANHSQGNNQSPKGMTTPPRLGSAAFPIEIDLEPSNDENS